MRAGKQVTASQAGFGFVTVLLLVALSALGISVVAQVWSENVRREREQDLLRIGHLYQQALARYRDMSPGSVKRLPREMDELLLDRRFAGTVRHIRQLYRDPVSPGGDWEVLRDSEGQIRGVRSQSKEQPLASAGVKSLGLILPAAQRYADWKFIVKDPQ